MHSNNNTAGSPKQGLPSKIMRSPNGQLSNKKGFSDMLTPNHSLMRVESHATYDDDNKMSKMAGPINSPRRPAGAATQASNEDIMHMTNDSNNYTESEHQQLAAVELPHTPIILQKQQSPDKNFMSATAGDWDERQLTTLSKVLEKKKKHLTSYQGPSLDQSLHS